MECIDAQNKAMLEFTLAALPPDQTEMLEMIQQGIAQDDVVAQARRMFLNKRAPYGCTI